MAFNLAGLPQRRFGVFPHVRRVERFHFANATIGIGLTPAGILERLVGLGHHLGGTLLLFNGGGFGLLGVNDASIQLIPHRFQFFHFRSKRFAGSVGRVASFVGRLAFLLIRFNQCAQGFDLSRVGLA